MGPFVVAAETTRMPMIFTDAGGDNLQIVFANNSFLELFGRTREAILNRPLEEFLAASLDRLSHGSVKAALAQGKEGTWEVPCRCADGQTFLATLFTSPVRDGSGKLTHNFLSFVRSGEKGEGLVDRRDELNAIYADAPGFIAISEGPEHRYTFANAAYQRFVNCTDLVGRPFQQALPEIATPAVVDLLDNVFLTGRAYVGSDFKFSFFNENTGMAEHRYCDFVYQPIKSADGSVKGLFVEGYDVTEKHNTAVKMADLQREVIHLSRANAMGTMAATLAHEFNQPLTAIANYAETARQLIERDQASAQQTSHALDAIADLAHRTGEMIRNLRDLTAQRKSLWSNFDLGLAIAECIQLVTVGSNRSVEIDDHTSEAITVCADRIQIQQVIINLVKNGCESVDGDMIAKVAIHSSVKDEVVRVCISDNGIGVPLEAAEALFMFNNSSKDNGMGIGLSVSRTIIESHGGHIWLKNSSTAGSVFCFTLPPPGRASG